MGKKKSKKVVPLDDTTQASAPAEDAAPVVAPIAFGEIEQIKGYISEIEKGINEHLPVPHRGEHTGNHELSARKGWVNTWLQQFQGYLTRAENTPTNKQTGPASPNSDREQANKLHAEIPLLKVALKKAIADLERHKQGLALLLEREELLEHAGEQLGTSVPAMASEAAAPVATDPHAPPPPPPMPSDLLGALAQMPLGAHTPMERLHSEVGDPVALTAKEAVLEQLHTEAGRVHHENAPPHQREVPTPLEQSAADEVLNAVDVSAAQARDVLQQKHEVVEEIGAIAAALAPLRAAESTDLSAAPLLREGTASSMTAVAGSQRATPSPDSPVVSHAGTLVGDTLTSQSGDLFSSPLTSTTLVGDINLPPHPELSALSHPESAQPLASVAVGVPQGGVVPVGTSPLSVTSSSSSPVPAASKDSAMSEAEEEETAIQPTSGGSMPHHEESEPTGVQFLMVNGAPASSPKLEPADAGTPGPTKPPRQKGKKIMSEPVPAVEPDAAKTNALPQQVADAAGSDAAANDKPVDAASADETASNQKKGQGFRLAVVFAVVVAAVVIAPAIMLVALKVLWAAVVAGLLAAALLTAFSLYMVNVVAEKFGKRHVESAEEKTQTVDAEFAPAVDTSAAPVLLSKPGEPSSPRNDDAVVPTAQNSVAKKAAVTA
ncbi:MAG: hypothetical protein V4490_04990 [Pseudomonadota bacterium]